MKKGVTIDTKYDKEGNYYYVLRKEKGKFSLDEIQEIMTFHVGEEGYYAVILKCFDLELVGWYDDDIRGDAVEVYLMTDVLKAFKRVRERQL